jgi:transcriptional regulator with XRE-family HTH domain
MPTKKSVLTVSERRPRTHCKDEVRPRIIQDIQIGSRIRKLRLSMGLTLYDLAERADTSFNQLHKFEIGQNRMSAGQLYLIACALDVPVDYFFGGSRQDIGQLTDNRRLRQFRKNLSRITEIAELRVIGQVIRLMKPVE